MLHITIDRVPEMVELCRKSKNNLLVIGDPGVGKSQTILGLANEHCKVTMLTGSSTYEETANGIPRDNKETKRQDYTRPEWFVEMLEWSKTHTDPEDYQVLFIDEFNTADGQVLKTFLSILSERKIPTQPEPIPENVVMVAAMNPCNQNEGEELIRPMASRFITVQIEVSLDDFKKYVSGENKSEVSIFDIKDKPEEISADRKTGYIDQIAPEDWQKFEPGSYHEINPRSMVNFFRALAWIDNRKQASGKLSSAFFGKNFYYPDDIKTKEKKIADRKEKVKKGAVIPTRDELKEMDTETLKKLRLQMMSKGANGIACVANILEILTERGEN